MSFERILSRRTLGHPIKRWQTTNIPVGVVRDNTLGISLIYAVDGDVAQVTEPINGTAIGADARQTLSAITKYELGGASW